MDSLKGDKIRGKLGKKKKKKRKVVGDRRVNYLSYEIVNKNEKGVTKANCCSFLLPPYI